MPPFSRVSHRRFRFWCYEAYADLVFDIDGIVILTLKPRHDDWILAEIGRR